MIWLIRGPPALARALFGHVVRAELRKGSEYEMTAFGAAFAKSRADAGDDRLYLGPFGVRDMEVGGERGWPAFTADDHGEGLPLVGRPLTRQKSRHG